MQNSQCLPDRPPAQSDRDTRGSLTVTLLRDSVRKSDVRHDIEKGRVLGFNIRRPNEITESVNGYCKTIRLAILL